MPKPIGLPESATLDIKRGSLDLRIMVTGSSGHLGSVVLRQGPSEGFLPTGVDLTTGPGGKVLDITDFSCLRKTMAGHDAVVHAAALHGTHVKRRSMQDFLQVNVQGTEHVLRAAADNGIPHVVLMSSTSVYGISKDPSVHPTVMVDELTPARPNDANDLSKTLCEQVAEYAARVYGLSVTVLRAGRFFVDDPLPFQLLKLTGAVDVTDVAQAVFRTLRAGGGGYRVYCIAARTHFMKADLPLLGRDAGPVIENRYPGATRAAEIVGLKLPKRLHRIVAIERAACELGFRPKFSFGDFVRDALCLSPEPC